MLQMNNQNMSFNGNSMLNEEPVMDMSVSTDKNQVWITLTINNIGTYLANEDYINADFLEFKDIVTSSLNKMIGE